MSNEDIRTFREKDRDPGLRRIGELMPAVLARYGIETDREQRQSESVTIAFVPMAVDFAIGWELSAAP
jgi:hypothetical protein